MSFLEDVFSPAAGMADLAGGDKSVFGTKPKVAPFVPVKLPEETGKAIAGNVENFDAINAFLNKVVPGFTDTLTQGLGISKEEMAASMPLLKGEIPQDVLDQVGRTSAFKSLQGGYGGTPMAQANAARNYGLTSLDLIGKGAELAAAGQNSAQMWTDLAEKAFSPWTVSTSQQAALTGINLTGEQQTQQLLNNIRAAPDPAALAKYNTNIAIGQQLVGIVGGLLGGGMGGGGQQSTTAPPAQAAQWTYNPSTNAFEQKPNVAGAWGYGG